MAQVCAGILLDEIPGCLALIVAEKRPGPAQSRLAKFSASRDVELLLHEGSVNDADTLARIASAKPSNILSIDNFQILGSELLQSAEKGCVNFHNAPLSTYRGVNAPSWALFNGETKHGVSWHTMEASVDTGSIIAGSEFDLSPAETALSLTVRCVEAGLEAFRENVNRIVSAGPGTPVDTSGSKLYRRSDLPNGGYLDPNWTHSAIDRMLRATDYRPYPNTFTYSKLRFGEWDLIVNSARGLGASTGAPGEILRTDDTIVMSCADQDLELSDVMIEPDREVSNGDAIRALGLTVGARFSPHR